MNNQVQFDEPTYGNQMPIRQRDSLPTRLVLKMGVKREQVSMVLIGVAVVAIIIGLLMASMGDDGPQGPIPQGTSETVPG